MRIRLSAERRETLVAGLRNLFRAEFDVPLSEFQARRLLDFCVKHLGAPVYNQAIQDARAHLQTRLDDLDGELYEPDESA
jgi:uncharacterized protein (DUF2164 family)